MTDEVEMNDIDDKIDEQTPLFQDSNVDQGASASLQDDGYETGLEGKRLAIKALFDLDVPIENLNLFDIREGDLYFENKTITRLDNKELLAPELRKGGCDRLLGILNLGRARGDNVVLRDPNPAMRITSQLIEELRNARLPNISALNSSRLGSLETSSQVMGRSEVERIFRGVEATTQTVERVVGEFNLKKLNK